MIILNNFNITRGGNKKKERMDCKMSQSHLLIFLLLLLYYNNNRQHLYANIGDESVHIRESFNCKKKRKKKLHVCVCSCVTGRI